MLNRYNYLLVMGVSLALKMMPFYQLASGLLQEDETNEQ